MHLPSVHASLSLRCVSISASPQLAPLTMQSMKEPLGIIDTRMTMSDTPGTGLLSPSFASVLAFDDPPQYTTTALDDFRTLDLRPRKQPRSDETGGAVDESGKERRHPRLELDVALDKYHTLDGFAELLNPQNTPASHSGCNSPGEVTGRGNNKNLPDRSAPTARVLGLDWSEDQPEADLIYFPGDGDDEFKTRKRRATTASPPSFVSSFDATKDVQLATDECTNKEAVSDESSPLRCVRFTPPLKSGQRQTFRSVQRAIPSVERDQGSIATYRQRKQHEKWGSPNRARAQRVAPYRNSGKISQSLTAHSNRLPDIRFSPRAKLRSRRNERSASPSLESRDQDAWGQEGPGVTSASTDNSRNFNGSVVFRQAYDLAVVSFNLYHFRLAETWRFNSLRLEISSTILPVTPTFQNEPQKQAVTRMAVENLLLHASFIVPAPILRVPLVAVSAAGQLAHSRVGLAVFHPAMTLWLLFARLVHTDDVLSDGFSET